MLDADLIRDTLRFAQDDEAEAALDRLVSELETARRALDEIAAKPYRAEEVIARLSDPNWCKRL